MTSELIDGSIFLHIPKTGGTWVCRVLQEMALIRREVGKHAHAGFVQATMYPQGKKRWKEWGRLENWKPENWLRPGVRMKMPRTFCFVRHPVAWYESWWRYLRGKNGDIPWLVNGANVDRYVKRWNPLSAACETYCEDFHTYMARLHGKFPGYVTWLYGQYATPEVDFVGKQENLREDLREVLALFGLAFDEGMLMGKRRINEAEFNEEPVVWDPGLLREVQAAEGTAMQRYGYSEIGVKELEAA